MASVKPPTAYEVVLEYIRYTNIKTGLKTEAMLDTNKDETGKKTSDKQLKGIRILRNEFHRGWNSLHQTTSVMPDLLTSID